MARRMNVEFTGGDVITVFRSSDLGDTASTNVTIAKKVHAIGDLCWSYLVANFDDLGLITQKDLSYASRKLMYKADEILIDSHDDPDGAIELIEKLDGLLHVVSDVCEEDGKADDLIKIADALNRVGAMVISGGMSIALNLFDAMGLGYIDLIMKEQAS